MKGTIRSVEPQVRRRTPRPASDYSRLLMAVQAADLFRRRYLYYMIKIALLTTGWPASGHVRGGRKQLDANSRGRRLGPGSHPDHVPES